jgi:hypothetical protein
MLLFKLYNFFIHKIKCTIWHINFLFHCLERLVRFKVGWCSVKEIYCLCTGLFYLFFGFCGDWDIFEGLVWRPNCFEVCPDLLELLDIIF